ncbi:hypothetical protein B0H19DRAFT_1274740 [Mycena capillaripes]|nr:hypothetical protein B0H19DRAFT_1274740 [Mycena capillaripes]
MPTRRGHVLRSRLPRPLEDVPPDVVSRDEKRRESDGAIALQTQNDRRQRNSERTDTTNIAEDTPLTVRELQGEQPTPDGAGVRDAEVENIAHNPAKLPGVYARAIHPRSAPLTLAAAVTCKVEVGKRPSIAYPVHQYGAHRSSLGMRTGISRRRHKKHAPETAPPAP